MNRRRLRIATALAATTAAVAGMSTAEAAPAAHRAEPCPTLTVTEGWHADNKSRLQDLIDEYGTCATGNGARPVAVFDWDNTVVKNDVGDATMFWLLRNSRIKTPYKNDWHTTSRYLTDDAATALRQACPTTTGNLPTGRNTVCADEILSVYADGETTAGKAAFAGHDRRRMEPSYAWLAQLTRGWTAHQVQGFAAAARKENLAAPVGTKRRVGTKDVTGWVRYYDQQRDLIRALHKAGFDVWISSASPQPVVEAWARGTGIGPDRVIGIRSVVEQGRLTRHLKGCGTVADGDDSMITYIDGKRCWINQEVYGVHGAPAEQVQPAHRRPVFAAGDSDTDVSFLRDATALRLVINRNKAELMCRAYDNSDGRWLVNPMFIEPKKQQSTPYPCASTGYTHSDGSSGPVLRGDGSVVPDQEDTVY
ncbi:haloacid dehalogenase-like hydrolase [Streptomyces sp. TRM66268-LWL]|uniref:phosphoserine phosphatase n=1 Tax=Streptomyces polyasparticus TaxID=2767826 RepID=A0ABR7SJ40_9ACTN|nr:haloacid dehalogenase-like hydrolase [Streptomyces polyasparticus]MBC9715516.1 haloacid dehalogenase-like hydrolase [Streptomyces polyasparticus]